jgi:MFS-type transporter involved in bile tolerance (Atg22 family)
LVVIKDATGSAKVGLLFLSALLVISFALTMALRVGDKRPAVAHGKA